MTGTIYIATNKLNGKRYVGQTYVSVRTRIRRHFNEKKDVLFSKALRKYGTDGFDVQPIIYARNELNEWEKYFISKLNTLSPNGYNLTSGGNHNYVFSDDVRKKIGDAGRGRVTSDETKKKISAAISGEKHYHYGGSVSEETRKKLSDSHKGKKWTPEMYGNFTIARTGIPHSEETKRKMSIAHRGFKHTDEAKKKMSFAKTGTHHDMTEDTKENIRLAKKGKYSTVIAAYKGWETRRMRINNEFTANSSICPLQAY